MNTESACAYDLAGCFGAAGWTGRCARTPAASRGHKSRDIRRANLLVCWLLTRADSHPEFVISSFAVLLSSFYDQHLFLLEIVGLGSSRLTEKTGGDFFACICFCSVFCRFERCRRGREDSGLVR